MKNLSVKVEDALKGAMLAYLQGHPKMTQKELVSLAITQYLRIDQMRTKTRIREEESAKETVEEYFANKVATTILEEAQPVEGNTFPDDIPPECVEPMARIHAQVEKHNRDMGKRDDKGDYVSFNQGISVH